MPDERRWTSEHGADELYNKFKVIRQRTGEEIDPQFFFVLLPEWDEAACTAVEAYADACEHRAPNLARQLREKIDHIREVNAS